MGLSKEASCFLQPSLGDRAKDGKDLSDTILSLVGRPDSVTASCVTYLDKCIPDQFVFSGKLLTTICLAMGSRTKNSVLL